MKHSALAAAFLLLLPCCGGMEGRAGMPEPSTGDAVRLHDPIDFPVSAAGCRVSGSEAGDGVEVMVITIRNVGTLPFRVPVDASGELVGEGGATFITKKRRDISLMASHVPGLRLCRPGETIRVTLDWRDYVSRENGTPLRRDALRTLTWRLEIEGKVFQLGFPRADRG